jgi:hypothetical protein
MRSIACLVSFLLLVAPGAARAGGPPSSVQPETVIVERKVERYGLQIVLADVLWVAATSAIGEVTEDGGGEGALSVLGLGFYATGPAVHLAHGNKSGALKSLGARALLPVGGALVGMALAGEDDDFDALGGMLLGFTAGGLTALILDWTVFSKKETTTYTSGFALRKGLRPGVKIQRDGLALSLAGSF